MPEGSKLVFFDFCETLISFQTADRYVDFCRERLRKTRMRLLQCVVSILTRLQLFWFLDRLLPGNTMRKRMILSQLKGLSYAELDRLAKAYYEQCLKPSIIPMMVMRLQKHVEAGDSVWIVSGGYDIYIKYFVEAFGLAGYISTEIAFSDSKICSGTICGVDCMYENKVVLLRSRMAEALSEQESVAYSDSRSDLPLLLMATEGYVVSKGHSQEWNKNYNLKELIWE
ncbi:MAG: HAD-IB family hydrolase [Alistipes sp.]|nr:HAD-IB family hydrolase [Alistipes senegalensis]MCM1249566.1 HAD-IB family hydrolase [Alistipes sp.]